MCKAAWKESFLSGQELLRVLCDQRTMGVKQVTLGWRKTLWTPMWIDHIYACVAILARFSSFSPEGSHVRLKGCGGTVGGGG